MSARRSWRVSARTLMLLSLLFSATSQAASYTLFIKPGTHTINGAGGATLKVWGYTDNVSAAPMVPGPVLESHEGESVTVTVYNQDSRAHNFVVSGVTTDTGSIAAGSNKTYTFTTPKAGVYLYNDTLNSNINREMGMYGVLKVKPADGGNTAWTGGPAYSFDRVWVVSEMDKPRWNDVAGAGTGVVDAERLLGPARVRSGDCVIAMGSSGLHSNGYSLARLVLLGEAGPGLAARIDVLGRTVGEELLEPTRIYVKSVLPQIKAGRIKGLAHITGGGLIENPPRAIAKGLEARFDWDAWSLPPVFAWLQETGGVADLEMRRTFNCGVGLLLIVSPQDLPAVLDGLLAAGEDAFVCGELAKAAA